MPSAFRDGFCSLGGTSDKNHTNPAQPANMTTATAKIATRHRHRVTVRARSASEKDGLLSPFDVMILLRDLQSQFYREIRHRCDLKIVDQSISSSVAKSVRRDAQAVTIAIMTACRPSIRYPEAGSANVPSRAAN